MLRIALQIEPKSLNPLLVSNTQDTFISRFMFLPLVEPDAQGIQQPVLASAVPSQSNGGISADGLTITYRLRRDVKWTDGEPVTSKDVKFSWQALMNPRNDVISRHGYDDITSIDTPDPYTAVVHLKRRFAPFVNTFFTDSDQPYSIVPEHVLAKYPDVNQIPFNSEPSVSDGPFKFGQWVHNDHITLIANDGFFRGAPGLKRIEIKIVPDENTSVELLHTHAIDWLYQASIRLYPEVRGLPDTRIEWMRVNGYYSLLFNTQSPQVSDARVRRAIAFATDKRNLVRTTMYGQETIATEDLPNWIWAYDPAVRSQPFDLERSRSLLARAGYTPGPGGIVRKDGQPLSLLLVTENSNATYRQLAVQTQAALRKIGVDVQIKLFPGAQLYAPAGEGGILGGGKFDIAIFGWYAGTDPDDSAQFTCKNVAPAGYNYARYCNRDMDAAQALALTRYDEGARKAAYAKTQALLARDVPQIFFNYLRQMEPISVDFKGLDPNAVEENWNAWEWKI